MRRVRLTRAVAISGLFVPLAASLSTARPGPLPVEEAGKPRVPGRDELPARRAVPHPSAEATGLRDEDMVMGVQLGKEARAYPVSELWDTTGHTVNDTLGGSPLVVSMCPLAGVSRAFSPRVDSRTLTLGSLDTVDRGSLVLYDTDTGTRFDLLGGRATEGPLAGRTLRRLPTLFTTWSRWKALYPNTTVHLDPEASPVVRVDAGRMKRILLTGRGPASSRDWILGFDDAEPPAALLVRAFVDRRVANFVVGGRPVAAFVTSDLTTVVTWRRTVGDRVLTFRAEGDLLVDQETGSSWDPLTGRAVTGALRGRTLEWAESSGGFWHAWQAHNLDTVMIDPG